MWGRVRRVVESADAQAQASADDFGVVLLTLTADVAQNYFALRSLDAQDEILTRSVELFRDQVGLTTTQRNAGIVGQTDLLQGADPARRDDRARGRHPLVSGRTPSTRSRS